MTIVAVSGGFDPCHDGHINHLREAAKLGKVLLVMVSSDQDMIRKKGKVCIPLKLRVRILQSIVRYYNLCAIVVETLDSDGTMTKTIENYLPTIYAKGGDRTPENMPKSEIEMCNKLGIQIVYGVGEVLNSSTKIMKRADLAE